MRFDLGAAFALMLSLMLPPVAQAGFYAQHDDIGGALEDLLDGYGRPNDCPEDEEDENGECPEEDTGEEGESDGAASDDGASGDEFSWIEWLILVLATAE